MGKKRHRDKACCRGTELNRTKPKSYPRLKYAALICLAGILLVATAGAAWLYSSKTKELTLQNLMVMSPSELEGIDIAEMNLLCATGLPGSENLDISSCLATLDQWADRVNSETQRYFHQYQTHPEKFKNMEGYFRMQVLITVLYQDFGVHYSGNRSGDEPADTFFANSGDIFLNGLIGQKREGTCASIPVLVVAIARRLGYPVYLVPTRAHAFARWDDGKDRFNIEATNKGMSSHPDDYYLTWPRPITPEMMEAEGYLKSMSAKEELASFLSTRICCLDANGRIKEAKRVSLRGSELVPSSKLFRTYRQ